LRISRVYDASSRQREDVNVVQELLRHSSSRITMDIYAQAQMPAKRAAQQKVVEMVRSEKPTPEAKKMA
jgi:integrase